MSGLDLQELINMPGAGKAAVLVARAGFWDPYAGDGPEREFTAELVGEVGIARACVVVRARSQREARVKVRDQVLEGRVSWDIPDPTSFDIETCLDEMTK